MLLSTGITQGSAHADEHRRRRPCSSCAQGRHVLHRSAKRVPASKKPSDDPCHREFRRSSHHPGWLELKLHRLQPTRGNRLSLILYIREHPRTLPSRHLRAEGHRHSPAPIVGVARQIYSQDPHSFNDPSQFVICTAGVQSTAIYVLFPNHDLTSRATAIQK